MKLPPIKRAGSKTIAYFARTLFILLYCLICQSTPSAICMYIIFTVLPSKKDATEVTSWLLLSVKFILRQYGQYWGFLPRIV